MAGLFAPYESFRDDADDTDVAIGSAPAFVVQLDGAVRAVRPETPSAPAPDARPRRGGRDGDDGPDAGSSDHTGSPTRRARSAKGRSRAGGEGKLEAAARVIPAAGGVIATSLALVQPVADHAPALALAGASASVAAWGSMHARPAAGWLRARAGGGATALPVARPLAPAASAAATV